MLPQSMPYLADQDLGPPGLAVAKEEPPEAAYDAQQQRRVSLRQAPLQVLDLARQDLDPQLLRLRLGLKAAERLARRPAAGTLMR